MEELRQWLEELPVHQRLYAQAGLLVIVLVLAWLGNFITKKIVALHAEKDQNSITINPLPRGFSVSFTF